MEEQVDMVKKAFLIAQKGFVEAGKSVFSPETLKKLKNSEQDSIYWDKLYIYLAPMAAEIYRQMTSVIVLTMGDEEHAARKSDLDLLQSVVERSGMTSNFLVGSHDLHIYSTNMERIELIIEGLMESSKEECLEGKEEDGCGHK
jgi:hypothetical protein